MLLLSSSQILLLNDNLKYLLLFKIIEKPVRDTNWVLFDKGFDIPKKGLSQV
jgi:hypothetical protein